MPVAMKHRIRFRWAGLKIKPRGAMGKIRRFYATHLQPERVEQGLARRTGDCHRCGYCCKILYRCPFLRGDNVCAIYEQRYTQCRLYPIEPGDLREVPGQCGYHFQNGDGAR